MNFRSLMRHPVVFAGFIFFLPLAHAEPAPPPDPTTFALAIETGQTERVNTWLKEGLNPDFTGDRIGSGLMIAAWHGNIPMMELFIQRGAQINLTNRYDEQALQLAAWRGHIEAVRWLLEHGAKPDRDGARWSALHYAAFANRPDISRLLLERGAQINARAPNGSTVLMMAAREGHAGLARLLLEAGADPKATNEAGDDALAWAMRHGHYTLAKTISGASDFAQAAKALPAHDKPPRRSVAAPPEMEEILQQIRLAEAAGQPATRFRQQLMAAVERYKKGSQRIVIGEAAGKAGKTAPRGKPAALMITAKRPEAAAQTGERAELVYRGTHEARPPHSADKPETTGSSSKDSDASEISLILEQMQRARASGQPVEALRQKLYQAVARAKSAS